VGGGYSTRYSDDGEVLDQRFKIRCISLMMIGNLD
jgi:hypothetical protein